MTGPRCQQADAAVSVVFIISEWSSQRLAAGPTTITTTFEGSEHATPHGRSAGDRPRRAAAVAECRRSGVEVFVLRQHARESAHRL